MSNTLLPCPFCGAPGLPLHLQPTEQIGCIGCSACGPESDTEDGAALAWNRRAVRDDERAHETRIVDVRPEDIQAAWKQQSPESDEDDFAQAINARLRQRARGGQ